MTLFQFYVALMKFQFKGVIMAISVRVTFSFDSKVTVPCFTFSKISHPAIQLYCFTMK